MDPSVISHCANKCSEPPNRCCLQCNSNPYCDQCCDRDHTDHIQISISSYKKIMLQTQAQLQSNSTASQYAHKISYATKLQQLLNEEVRKMKEYLFTCSELLSSVMSANAKEAIINKAINSYATTNTRQGMVSNVADSDRPIILVTDSSIDLLSNNDIQAEISHFVNTIKPKMEQIKRNNKQKKSYKEYLMMKYKLEDINISKLSHQKSSNSH